jgi:hypothetical protein
MPEHRPAHVQAACDVGQADDRQGPARHRGRQAAQVHFGGQVGDQEGDVKAAGGESGVQQQVAAVAKGLAQRLAADRRPPTGSPARASPRGGLVRGPCGSTGGPAAAAPSGRWRPSTTSPRPSRAPAAASGSTGANTSSSERAAGIDHARGCATGLGGQSPARPHRSSTAKLLPPEPIAVITPRHEGGRQRRLHVGCESAVPANSSAAATPSSTGPGPYRSDRAPAIGCAGAPVRIDRSPSPG